MMQAIESATQSVTQSTTEFATLPCPRCEAKGWLQYGGICPTCQGRQRIALNDVKAAQQDRVVRATAVIALYVVLVVVLLFLLSQLHVFSLGAGQGYGRGHTNAHEQAASRFCHTACLRV